MSEGQMCKTVGQFLNEVEEDAKLKNTLPKNKPNVRFQLELHPRGTLKVLEKLRKLVKQQVENALISEDQSKVVKGVIVMAINIEERNSKVDPECWEMKGVKDEVILTVAAYLNSLG